MFEPLLYYKYLEAGEIVYTFEADRDPLVLKQKQEENETNE